MIDLTVFKNKYDIPMDIVFPYGSRVYGTYDEKSDHDFIVIVPDGHTVVNGTELRDGDYNIHVYHKKDWQDQLNLHKINTLECHYLCPSLSEKHFDFKLDKTLLRNELSQKSNHSFVKAKKKIEVEKDYYVGWKSLFHSLRILTFGIQIASEGNIYNYASANGYWRDIKSANQYNWAYFKEKYQPEYNKLATEFRKLAPKL